MLHVIVSDNLEERIKNRNSLIKDFKGVIYIDDSNSSISYLKEYLYPSLFNDNGYVIHGKFILENSYLDLDKNIIKSFVSSPTIFILEDNTLPSSFIKTLQKEGAFIYQGKDQKKVSKTNTIFEIANIFSLLDKKDKWLLFQKSIKEHSPEALIGILYWKLRSLMDTKANSRELYKSLYKKLIYSHKDSWQKGTPLSLAIEKFILEN